MDEEVDDQNPVHLLTNRRLPTRQLAVSRDPEHQQRRHNRDFEQKIPQQPNVNRCAREFVFLGSKIEKLNEARNLTNVNSL